MRRHFSTFREKSPTWSGAVSTVRCCWRMEKTMCAPGCFGAGGTNWRRHSDPMFFVINRNWLLKRWKPVCENWPEPPWFVWWFRIRRRMCRRDISKFLLVTVPYSTGSWKKTTGRRLMHIPDSPTFCETAIKICICRVKCIPWRIRERLSLLAQPLLRR